MPDQRTNGKTGTVKKLLQSAAKARLERLECERMLFMLKRERAVLSEFCKDETEQCPNQEALCRLLDAQERELTERMEDCLRQMRQVTLLIDLLPDRRHRVILFLRYVDALGWNAIRTTLEKEYDLWYENRQIYRLHNAALQELEACAARIRRQ